MLKKKLALVGFLSVLNLPLCLYYATFFAPSVDKSPWFVLTAYGLAAVGHFCLYFLLGALLLIFPVTLFKRKVTALFFTYCTVIVALMHIVLAVDAHVFALYRFHLTLAMLDLFFNTGGQVISFSFDTILSIAMEAGLIILYAVIATALAFLLAIRGFKSKKFVILFILCYVLANGVHAYAHAKSVLPLTEISNRLPLYKPLTMNTMLIRLGVVTREELANTRLTISEDGLFDYPKAPLQYGGVKQDVNVIYFLVDALRADMLTEEIMPHTYALSRDNAYVFRDHYSASNSTRGGVFGLFYGLPPSYWQVALSSGIPSATVRAVQESGYRLGVFTSATITKPEFSRTVFAGVPNLRVSSTGDNIFDRDRQCLEDFKNFVKADPSRRFFSFIFVDNVHSAAVPEDAPRPFQPAWTTVNHMDLNASTDPTPYFNLYKNAAYYADTYVADLISFLKEQNLMENTVIVISSDHGEEFNDNGDNYWGHNSNFTAAQLHIPLVVKWPNMGGGNIARRTTAYDLTATILPRVFGVSNPVADYSIGQDLFTGKGYDYFLTGSYLENAIVEKDRIVLIDNVGMLRFLDLHYRDSSDTGRDAHLLEAMQTFGEYLKKD